MDRQRKRAFLGDMSVAALEDLLIEAWAGCLGIRSITADDEFLDLGGNSIIAMQVAATISEQLGADVPHRDIVDCGNVRNLARHIRTNAPRYFCRAELTAVHQAMPTASYAQKFWWDFRGGERIDPLNGVVHTFRMKGTLAPVALHKSLVSIAARHDSLRMMFEERDGQLFMRIAEAWQSEEFVRNDLCSGTLDEAEIRDAISRMTLMPIDLYNGPVFRAGLWRISADDHLLVFVWHHIVFDDQSDRIFFRELQLHYEAYSQDGTPELLPVQSYVELAAREQALYATAKYREQVQFWHTKLSDISDESLWWTSLLSLTGDEQIEAIKSEIKLSGDRLTELIRLGVKLKLSLSSLLLAATQFTLYLVFRRQRVITTTIFSQRFTSEQQRLIGLQIALLPIVSIIDERITVRVFLQSVSQECAEASRHSDVNLRALKDIYGVDPWIRIGKVFYNYIEKDEEEWLRLNGLHIERFEWRPKRRFHIRPNSVLMGIGVLKSKESMRVSWGSCIPQVNQELLDLLSSLHHDILDELVQDPEATLGDLSRRDRLSKAVAGVRAFMADRSQPVTPDQRSLL